MHDMHAVAKQERRRTSPHFEKRRAVKASTSTSATVHAQSTRDQEKMNPSKRQSSDSGDDSFQWESMATEWRRCETMWLTWNGGHGPFNVNATSYPDGVPYGSSEGALQWQIAYLVGNHDYQWTARAPPNTTFYFDVQDTSTGVGIDELMPIHINSQYAQGLSSCQVDYSGVTTPTPGSVTVRATSSASAGGGGTSSSSSSAIASASPSNGTSSIVTETEGSTSATSQSSKNNSSNLKAAHAGIAILALALAAMLFMQYRLRKKLARLHKGQSTVGRWMNHHDTGFSNADASPNKRQNYGDGSPTSSPEEQYTRPMSNSSNLYATSESSGRTSTFFEHRSASRTARHRPVSRDLTSATLTRRFSTSSTSSDMNPFDDDAKELDEDDEDLLHRSASQQKRYSQAESAISDSNTATSGSRLSSVAPSDQLSSVGNVSVVSDDHYHRAKAFTIGAQGGGGTTLDGARKGGQFLDPHMGLLGSRR